MAPQFILTMRDLRRVHPPDREVLRGINISMYPGAKIGVLGGNGAGKSSLLRIIAGEDDGYQGECRVTPGFSVGFLPQEPRLDENKDVVGNVTEGVAHTKGLLDRFEEVCNAMGDADADFDKLLAEQAELQDQIDAVNGWDLDRQLEIAMDALRLPPSDADVTKLSGGERRRVALCRLLLSKPDLLLLDEPTNHLDAESVAWLERHLQEYHGTVVAVTHDRYFLDNVAGWILELDRGQGIPWEGNYSSWLEQKDARLAQEEKVDETRRRTLERELEWIRMAPRARQAKGKARITAYEQLVAEAESAEKRQDRLQISIPPGPRLGEIVVEAEQLRKAYDEKLLLDDFSFSLPRGGIVGVVGPNGAGKTTLFRMLVGQEQPDDGALNVGPTVSFAYVDQSRESLDGKKSVYEEITGGVDHLKVGDREVHGRAYVAGLQLQGLRPAEARRRPLGWRAQPVAPRQGAADGRQRAPARRAHQRSRRRHAARTRRSAARVPGLRGGHQPRSLVHRPHRDTRPRVRRRERGAVVRGQLLRLREGSAQAARHRRRPTAPHPLQEADDDSEHGVHVPVRRLLRCPTCA